MDKKPWEDEDREQNAWLDPQVIDAIQSLRDKLEALEEQIRKAEALERERSEKNGWEDAADDAEPLAVDTAEEAADQEEELPLPAEEPPAAAEAGEPEPPSLQAVAVEQPVEEEKEPRKRLPPFAWVLIGLVAVLLVGWFFAWPVVIADDLMAPVLNKGDLVLVNRTDTSLYYGDIVMLRRQALRVVGLAGDEMTMDEESGLLLRDGVPVELANTKQPESGMQALKTTVGERDVFLMGDNAVMTGEDNPDAPGVAARSAVQGKPWLKVLPFSHFGRINKDGGQPQ